MVLLNSCWPSRKSGDGGTPLVRQLPRHLPALCIIAVLCGLSLAFARPVPASAQGVGLPGFRPTDNPLPQFVQYYASPTYTATLVPGSVQALNPSGYSVPGQYCADSSGGTLWVPAGAPA